MWGENSVEQNAPPVEGDGQAEGGEGEVQRLPFLGDHQGHGYRDAHRHQHEDFHRPQFPSSEWVLDHLTRKDDESAKSRHPGESRGPVIFVPAPARRDVWIPLPVRTRSGIRRYDVRGEFSRFYEAVKQGIPQFFLPYRTIGREVKEGVAKAAWRWAMGRILLGDGPITQPDREWTWRRSARCVARYAPLPDITHLKGYGTDIPNSLPAGII